MIYLILIFGTFLRFISLDQSLWLDEAIVVKLVDSPSLFEVITNRAWYDMHPPGYHIVLWGWTQLMGYSEIILRLPSVVTGVATIGVAYLIGIELANRKVGLISAWLVAINPLLLYYSQEARMYQMATLLVALNFYFFTRMIKDKGGKLGFILSTSLVLMIDYVAYFSFLAEFVILLTWYRPKFKVWFFCLIPGALLWIWWLPIFVKQALEVLGTASDLPVWQKVVGGFDIKALVLTGVKIIFGRISIENKWLYGLLSVGGGLVYLMVILRGVLTNWKKIRVVMVMGILPIVAAWLCSGILPIFSYFRVLFCVPFIMIILGVILGSWKKWGVAMAIVISLISIGSGVVYLSRPEFQREDWRGVLAFLDQHQSDTSVVILESDGSFAPYDYYDQGRIKTIYGLQKFPATGDSDVNNLEMNLRDVNKVYLLEYLVDIADPNRLVEKKLMNLGFSQDKIDNFNGVGFVREFGR